MDSCWSCSSTVCLSHFNILRWLQCYSAIYLDRKFNMSQNCRVVRMQSCWYQGPFSDISFVNIYILAVIISRNWNHNPTKWISSFQGIPLYELSMFLFFLVPVGILLFLYISMGVVLHRAVVPGTNSSGSIHIASSTSRRDSHSQQRKQIIRMLGELVILHELQ